MRKNEKRMPPVILHGTFRQAPFLPLSVEREEHANARHTYSCHTYSLVSTQVSGGFNIHGLLLQNGVNEPIDSTHPEKPLFVECFPWYQKPLLLR